MAKKRLCLPYVVEYTVLLNADLYSALLNFSHSKFADLPSWETRKDY